MLLGVQMRRLFETQVKTVAVGKCAPAMTQIIDTENAKDRERFPAEGQRALWASTNGVPSDGT